MDDTEPQTGTEANVIATNAATMMSIETKAADTRMSGKSGAIATAVARDYPLTTAEPRTNPKSHRERQGNQELSIRTTEDTALEKRRTKNRESGSHVAGLTRQQI